MPELVPDHPLRQVLRQLTPAITSPKMIQILADFYTAERDSLASAVAGCVVGPVYQVEAPQ